MKPDSLEAKFKLMTIAPLDKRMKRKHLAVYGFILDWFHSKYGDALASIRHVVSMLKERDPSGAGLHVGDVHKALADLVAWGYLEQDKGSGRRASRYIPVWDIGSVQKSSNTTDDERSVSVSLNTSVHVSPNTTGDSVQDSPNEDPSTSTRSPDPGTRMDGYSCCAPPTAPPGSAPDGPTGAGGAQGGFEELWAEYGYKHKKREASAEYKRMAPDATKYAAIVVAARLWRQAAMGRPDPSQPRKYLHTWLRDDEFDCDPPVAFKTREKTVTSGTTTVAKRSQKQAARLVDIIHADVVGPESNKRLVVTFSERDKPLSWDHEIQIESSNSAKRQDGHAELAALVQALSLHGVSDTAELIGNAVTVESDTEGHLTYSPADEA